MTPAANGKKQEEKEKTDRNHTGTGQENQRPETPGTASRDKEETRHQGRFVFRLESAGSRVGALRSVLGSAPEGSALNPPPFQSQLGLDHRTGGQRRPSLEPQMELDHNLVFREGLNEAKCTLMSKEWTNVTTPPDDTSKEKRHNSIARRLQ